MGCFSIFQFCDTFLALGPPLLCHLPTSWSWLASPPDWCPDRGRWSPLRPPTWWPWSWWGCRPWSGGPAPWSGTLCPRGAAGVGTGCPAGSSRSCPWGKRGGNYFIQSYIYCLEMWSRLSIESWARLREFHTANTVIGWLTIQLASTISVDHTAKAVWNFFTQPCSTTVNTG